MKLILKEDIQGLGKAGQIINVKDGYARNYLLPRGLALLADERNLKLLEYQKKKFEEEAKKNVRMQNPSQKDSVNLNLP